MGTKLVAHEGTGTGMRIFYERRYENEHYSTLPKGNPLPFSHDSFGDGLITMKIHVGMTIGNLWERLR